MARSRDISLLQQGWIHDLAKAEVHPEAERLLELTRAFDPQQLVEESAVEFLQELKEHFLEHARVFNAYSEQGTRFHEVKVYGLAQSAADFMVFRNQVKLLVANVAHGVIQLSFAQHVRSTLSVDGQDPTGSGAGSQNHLLGQNQEILAQVGPFRDVFWTFQGEKVTPSQVAKFYFAEFVRATRDHRRSRTGNQLLLEQIKSLLQEKGLDL